MRPKCKLSFHDRICAKHKILSPMLRSRGLIGPIKATCLLGIYLDMLGKQNFIHIFQMKEPEKSKEIEKNSNL